MRLLTFFFILTYLTSHGVNKVDTDAIVLIYFNISGGSCYKEETWHHKRCGVTHIIRTGQDWVHEETN